MPVKMLRVLRTLIMLLLVVFVSTAAIWLNRISVLYSPLHRQEPNFEYSERQIQDSVLHTTVHSQGPPHFASESSDVQAHDSVLHTTVHSQGPPHLASESSDEQAHDSVLYTTVQSQEPPHLASESSDEQTHGYILNLNYPGQQGAGMRTLVSLQCSVGSFGLPMYIVEPSIVKSTLSSLGGSLRFSDYIDLNHFNTASRGAGYTELATREDYLQNAPRKVVFLKLLGGCALPRKLKSPRHNIPRVVWSADGQSKCYNNSLPGFHLHSQLLKEHDLCVVRLVQLNHKGSGILTIDEVYQHVLGEWKPEEVTLILSGWCPYWYITNASHHSPNLCEEADERGLDDRISPSKRLVKKVEEYEATQLGSNHTYQIAVMMRVEHLIRQYGDKRKHSTKDCFHELVNLVGKLQQSYSSPQTFVTSDIGKYGSKSWHTKLTEERRAKLFGDIKSTMFTLMNRRMTFEEWEDSFTPTTGGADGSGYIAALQRTIASRADCLVFLSGGQFLKLALQDYLHHHPNPTLWCVHFVCPEDSRPFTRIMDRRRSTEYQLH